MAKSRSQGHVAGTSALPLTADVRALMSASLSPRPRLFRLWLGFWRRWRAEAIKGLAGLGITLSGWGVSVWA